MARTGCGEKGVEAPFRRDHSHSMVPGGLWVMS